jgi:hypothetical protein
MKRTVQILVPLTLAVAIPLVGSGLVHMAGSVLLGGGGLTMTLMVALAIMSGRGVARAPRVVAPTVEPAATTATPAVTAAAPVTVAAAPPKTEPKAAAAAKAEPAKAEPKTAKLTKGQRKAAAKARAKAARAARAAAAMPAKPKMMVVEVAPEARSPEIEEVAAFFVKATVKNAEPANDGFAADELAFFAEGENQVMRASDSSPTWRLG